MKRPFARRKKMKEIDVLKAKTEMLSFLTDENCTIDPELRAGEGMALGQQVRVTVKVDADRYGLATLHSDYQDGTDDNDVRMRLSGRARFDETDSFDAYLAAAGVKQDKTKAQLEDDDEFGEFLDELNDTHQGVVCCAPHGGVIENYTDEQAERMHDRLVNVLGSKPSSCWRCAGWQDKLGAFAAWHITSADVSRASFPKLDSIGDRGFAHAVAFHGWSNDGILVGGNASADLKCTLRKAIEVACGGNVEVSITTGGAYSGTDPGNFVNWLTSGGSGGVQIEQSYYARQNYGQAIADAVAGVFAALL
jgi:phage replication-related protein YjqB (UPF0714/DUF867 family)